MEKPKGKVRKPDGLTTFGRADDFIYIYLIIKFLTLAFRGQYIPAKRGLSNWLFQCIWKRRGFNNRFSEFEVVSYLV
jgi:hypothetical protein